MKTQNPSAGTSLQKYSERAVSLLQLLDLYGKNHKEELQELWSAEGTHYLVLFADRSGSERAILQVGPDHEHRDPEVVMELQIEGLRAVCYTWAKGVSGAQLCLSSQALSGDECKDLTKDEPEMAKELEKELRVNPDLHPAELLMRMLVRKIKEVNIREADLARREKYVHEAEEKLSNRAEEHILRHAELDQREHEIDSALRDVERRRGDTMKPF